MIIDSFRSILIKPTAVRLTGVIGSYFQLFSAVITSGDDFYSTIPALRPNKLQSQDFTGLSLPLPLDSVPVLSFFTSFRCNDSTVNVKTQC